MTDTRSPGSGTPNCTHRSGSPGTTTRRRPRARTLSGSSEVAGRYEKKSFLTAKVGFRFRERLRTAHGAQNPGSVSSGGRAVHGAVSRVRRIVDGEPEVVTGREALATLPDELEPAARGPPAPASQPSEPPPHVS